MEDITNKDFEPRMVTVPEIEIIRKFETKTDRQNFTRENSEYILFNK